MVIRKRVHIIDPKTLRAGGSANDNEAGGDTRGKRKRHSTSNGVSKSSIAPERPSKPAQARRCYGLPDPSEFSQPGLLRSVLDRFLAREDAYDDLHHEVVRAGIVGRYQHALDLANNPQAFAAWKLEPKILGLSRPPTCADNICRALFQASHRDPKTASKRFKRIEPLWVKRCSAAEVLAFLEEKKGVAKASPKVSPDCREPGPGNSSPSTAKPNKPSKAPSGGNSDRLPAPTSNERDTPCGTFYFWPGKLTAGRFYDLRVKVLDHDGEAANFDLYDVSSPSAK